MKNNKHEETKTINIDLNLFTTEELIIIYDFLSLLEKNQFHKVHSQKILESYQKYRQVINSIALEKKYDKAFYQKTGISIYHTIKNIQSKRLK